MGRDISDFDLLLTNFGELLNLRPGCEVFDELIGDEDARKNRIRLLNGLGIVGQELPRERREAVLDAVSRYGAEGAVRRRMVAPHELVIVAHSPKILDTVQGASKPPVEPRPATAASGALPLQLGEYELLEPIGEGRWGRVFRARRRGLQHVVAVKEIPSGYLPAADQMRRFLDEADTIAKMNHPNLVPIYDFGEDRGRWYLSMELIDGVGLAEQLDRYKDDPRSAVRLMETIAHAAHHAHQRGVMHCDLKLSNILIDSKGQPHVTDFGLARRIRRLGEPDSIPPGKAGGTFEFMAPEQTLGESRSINMATDVYGLGAILYTLLTGRPPFLGDSEQAILEQVRRCPPDPPSRINPAVDRDLEAICLKCLEKDPRRRYGSADALAGDLERWLDGEPVLARPVGGVERLGRWCRQHPLEAALSAVAAGLLIAATMMAVWVARVRETKLVREACESNLFEAKHVASRVLWELKTLSDPVEREANDPRLSKLMQQSDPEGLQNYVKQTLDKYKKQGYNIQAWYVLDGQGKLLAASSMLRWIIGRYYDWRDYVREALRHAKTETKSRVHISRVLVADSDRLPKFAFSAPVFATSDHGGGLLGVVVATITTAADLGSLPLDDRGRTVVLVGRREPNSHRDPNSPRGTLPADQSPSPATARLPEFPILFHPGYPHPGVFPIGMPGARIRAVLRPRPNDECPGDEFRLPALSRPTDPAGEVVDNYRDPLGIDYPEYRGRWLAAFAPVGDTELVVGVQQQYDKAIPPDLPLARDAFLGAGVALALIAIVVDYAARRAARAKRAAIEKSSFDMYISSISNN